MPRRKKPARVKVCACCERPDPQNSATVLLYRHSKPGAGNQKHVAAPSFHICDRCLRDLRIPQSEGEALVLPKLSQSLYGLYKRASGAQQTAA